MDSRGDSFDLARWEARYAGADPAAPPPACAVLARNLHLLPVHGEALDLACGLGGNALALAGAGLSVFAWDISPRAIACVDRAAQLAGRVVHAQVRDVVARPPEPGRFDAIVVAHFLERELAPHLVDALRPGGVLYYQTFTRTRLTGRGPRRDEWRLAAGELLELFASLRPVVYREEGDLGDTSAGSRDEAMFVGCKCKKSEW